MSDTFKYTTGKVVTNSSMFNAYWYNENNRELLLSFKQTGSKRVYFDVDRDDFDDFARADSLGVHYNLWFKGELSSAPVESDINFEMVKVVDRRYTVNALLAGTAVAFEVSADNDEAAIAEFRTYVSRLNATDEWTLRTVTRHF